MSRRAKFKFRLYVAAGTPNSTRAVTNLALLCKTYLLGRHEIEVVNVFQEPQRALAEGIRMTPTLIKVAPPPVTRIVGTLNQTQGLLASLGLENEMP